MAKKDNPFKNLLKPIKIGPAELKHRMVLAPMNDTLSGHNGEAAEQLISYYAARAKGGASLVITGAIMGAKLVSQFVWGRNLYCFHPGHVQGLKPLTDRIHYFGSNACAQITTAFGRQGHSAGCYQLAPAFYK